MRFGLVLLFLLIHPLAYSQQSAVPKNYPTILLWHKKPIPKLAQRITAGASSDSEKVSRIHNWICYHIKQDLTKNMSHNHEKMELRLILKNAKANDKGYADLFEELCKCSGVKAITITGYLKHQYVDLGDPFYIPDHSWNAVLIGSTWKLVDLSMDAGMLLYFKRKFSLFNIFKEGSFYKKNVYYLSYMHRPNLLYYLKDGDYFSVDHLPANPDFQLRSHTISLTAFSNDSSYYYGRYPSVCNFNNAVNASALNAYCDKQPNERLLEDGVTFHQFNSHDRFDLIGALALQLTQNFDSIKLQSKDTIALKKTEKTGTAIFEQLALNVDSVKLFNIKQRALLTSHLQQKKKLLNANLQEMTQSNKRVQDQLTTVRTQLTIASNRHSKLVNKQESNCYQLQKSDKYDKVTKSKSASRVDSAKLMRQIQVLQDSIAKQQSQLKNHYAYLDSLFNVLTTALIEYDELQRNHIRHTFILINYRTKGNDDWDNNVYNTKKPCLKDKYRDDSLFLSKSAFLNWYSFYTAYKALHSQQQNFYKWHSAIASALTHLKAITHQDSLVNSYYIKNSTQLNKEFEEYKSHAKDYPSEFSRIKTLIHQDLNTLQILAAVNAMEKKIALVNYSKNASFINKREATYNRLCNKYALAAQRKLERSHQFIKGAIAKARVVKSAK